MPLPDSSTRETLPYSSSSFLSCSGLPQLSTLGRLLKSMSCAVSPMDQLRGDSPQHWAPSPSHADSLQATSFNPSPVAMLRALALDPNYRRRGEKGSMHGRCGEERWLASHILFLCSASMQLLILDLMLLT